MQEINPIELKERLDNGESIQLIDVRETFEHQAYNIGGKLIPLGEIMQHMEAFNETQPTVVYCRKGVRSMIAIQRLEEKLGELPLYNLSGGIEAWMNMLDRERD